MCMLSKIPMESLCVGTGNAGSILFGIWALCSVLIFWCFTCNLNAILFAPEYDTKVDTACQVLQHNLVRKSSWRDDDIKGTVTSDILDVDTGLNLVKGSFVLIEMVSIRSS